MIRHSTFFANFLLYYLIRLLFTSNSHAVCPKECKNLLEKYTPWVAVTSSSNWFAWTRLTLTNKPMFWGPNYNAWRSGLAVRNVALPYRSFTLRRLTLGMQCPGEGRRWLVDLRTLRTLHNQSVSTFWRTLHSQNQSSQSKRSVRRCRWEIFSSPTQRPQQTWWQPSALSKFSWLGGDYIRRCGGRLHTK